MSLDNAIAAAQKSVPDCVAVGFVDMKTGMLLAVRTVDSHPQEVLDLVAAATGDLFQGSNVSLIESMFKKTRGVKDDGRHYFQEIIVNSDNLVHVFQRCKKHDDLVLVTVCRASANLGMVLSKTRLHLTQIEATLTM